MACIDNVLRALAWCVQRGLTTWRVTMPFCGGGNAALSIKAGGRRRLSLRNIRTDMRGTRWTVVCILYRCFAFARGGDVAFAHAHTPRRACAYCVRVATFAAPCGMACVTTYCCALHARACAARARDNMAAGKTGKTGVSLWVFCLFRHLDDMLHDIQAADSSCALQQRCFVVQSSTVPRSWFFLVTAAGRQWTLGHMPGGALPLPPQ